MHQTESCTQRHPRQISSSLSALYGMMIQICSVCHLEEMPLSSFQGIWFRLSSRFKPVGIIKKSSGTTTCRTSTSQIYPVEQRISSCCYITVLSLTHVCYRYGHGAFREVRVLVDGQLAGVAFPFATLFTGVCPSFPRSTVPLIYSIGAWIPTIWRPVVAINAYDLPTYNIDLTPFVPLLTDGNNHTITLDVASDEPDHRGSCFTTHSRLGQPIWCSCWTYLVPFGQYPSCYKQVFETYNWQDYFLPGPHVGIHHSFCNMWTHQW